MSTTLLMIEYLLAGLLAIAALVLFMSGLGVDLRWLATLAKANDLLGATLVFALAYPVGVFVDETADQLGARLRKRLRHQEGLKVGQTVQAIMTLAPTAHFVHRLFEHKRTRIRIARCMAFTCILFLPGTVLQASHTLTTPHTISYLTLLIALLLWSLWCLQKFERSWCKTISQAWKDLKLTTPEEGLR